MNTTTEFRTPFSINKLTLPESGRMLNYVRAFISREITADGGQGVDCVYPVSPYPGLSWNIRGSRIVVERNGRPCRNDISLPVQFYGPNPDPIVSSEGPGLIAFDILLQPEAPHALFNIDIAGVKGRHCNAYEVVSTECHSLLRGIPLQDNHESRVRYAEDAIERLMDEVRAAKRIKSASPSRAIESIVDRISASFKDYSARHMQRKFVQLTGATKTQLMLLGRAEKAFLVARQIVLGEGNFDWSELAYRCGYYDQSHLCNEVKRLTGRTPEELRVLASRGDDSLWIFHIWS